MKEFFESTIGSPNGVCINISVLIKFLFESAVTLISILSEDFSTCVFRL